MSRQTFNTDKAAVTGGPYSQAVIHNGLVFLSGAGAVDPVSNELSLGSVEHEGAMALKNVRIILQELGSSLDKVLKVTVYLLDMDEFDRFNQVYRQVFPENQPARTCIQAAKLPFEIRVEIDVVAAL